jgi:hypothetical protein
MAFKHTAVTPDGKQHHRTSQNRQYPFAVAVGPVPVDEMIDRIEHTIAYEQSNVDRYDAVVAHLQSGAGLVERIDPGRVRYFALKEDFSIWVKRDVPEGVESWNSSKYRATQEQQNAAIEQQIVAYQGYADSSRESVARNEARIAELRESGQEFVGEWHIAGWQSRADLSFKFANTVRGYLTSKGCEVKVIEATFVETGRKQKVEA